MLDSDMYSHESEVQQLSPPLPIEGKSLVAGSINERVAGALSTGLEWRSDLDVEEDIERKTISEKIDRQGNSNGKLTRDVMATALVAMASISLVISTTSLMFAIVAMTTFEQKTVPGEVELNKWINYRRSEAEKAEPMKFSQQFSTSNPKYSNVKSEPITMDSTQQSPPEATDPMNEVDSKHKLKVDDCRCTAVQLAPKGTPAAFAHLSGAAISNSTAGSNVVVWTEHRDLSQISYQNGRLAILEDGDGVYFVYTQLYVIFWPLEGMKDVQRGQSPSGSGKASGILGYRLLRQNSVYPNGGVEILVQKNWTLVWTPNAPIVEQTSYVCSQIRLRPRDEVFVSWSATDLPMAELHHDSKRTYFGMLRVK